MLIALASVAAVAVIDVTAYLAAASRAQSLADAAALAAVTPAASAAPWRGAEAEALRVVHAGRGRLERCACRGASEYASVSVSVDVPGLVIPELGASRVTADADAILTRHGGGNARPDTP